MAATPGAPRNVLTFNQRVPGSSPGALTSLKSFWVHFWVQHGRLGMDPQRASPSVSGSLGSWGMPAIAVDPERE